MKRLHLCQGGMGTHVTLPGGEASTSTLPWEGVEAFTYTLRERIGVSVYTEWG